MNRRNSRFLRNILENAVSQFLQEHNHVVTAFREILVTDAEGRLVAASNKTSDYFQGDEQWWGNCYLEGVGNRYISDITFDESANVFGLEIAQPITDPPSDEVIGVIKAIADSAEIFATVDAITVSQEGQAVLMRADGTVIHSPSPTEGYEFLDENFTIGSLDRAYVEAQEREAFRRESVHVFLGLPQFYFRDRLPELDWFVVIQAPHSEVFAPFSEVNQRMIYLGLFSVVVIIVLWTTLYWRLAGPAIETDPHLEKL